MPRRQPRTTATSVIARFIVASPAVPRTHVAPHSRGATSAERNPYSRVGAPRNVPLRPFQRLDEAIAIRPLGCRSSSGRSTQLVRGPSRRSEPFALIVSVSERSAARSIMLLRLREFLGRPQDVLTRPVTYFSDVARTIGRTIAAIGAIGSRHAGSDELRGPTERSHRWPNPGRCPRQGKEREPDEHKPNHHGGQRVAVDRPHEAVHALLDRRLRVGREIDRGVIESL